jgi:hypothetical protein
MERMTRGVRQSGMMSPRQVRGIVVAGLLCAAVAGCGTVVAAGASSGQAAAPSTPAVGCASVNQATSVTVHRSMHPLEPARLGTLIMTQRKPALVRAMFGDFCKVIAHRDVPSRPVNCPAAFGLDYTGTFYAGHRELATFTYGASGCQSVDITAAGKSTYSLVMGAAAAAAPHLETDVAAVLGLPKSAVYNPVQQINPGGPNKPAKPAKA